MMLMKKQQQYLHHTRMASEWTH